MIYISRKPSLVRYVTDTYLCLPPRCRSRNYANLRFLRKNTKIGHFRREISLRQIGVTCNFFSPKRFYHGMRGCGVRQDDGKHVESVFIILQTYTIPGIPSFGRFPSLVGFTLIFGFSRKIHQKIMRLLTFLKDRVQLHHFFMHFFRENRF